MKTIELLPRVGAFAENKDVARDIRVQEILPVLADGDEVTLDFAGISAATQSFVHALISDVLRRYPEDALDRLHFKSCTVTVRKIIQIVVDYMQEGL